MKSIAKWVTIIWSIFCLIGVIVGVVNVSQNTEPSLNEYESAGSFLGLGLGLGIWFVIWIVIAGPAFIIYLVSGKKEPTHLENLQQQKGSRLCIECGNYYNDEPRFCPHCGKPTKLNI